MTSFGERLRREREMRKISLEEIAAATKISARHLRALEEEDFDRLPGGIFNKGFVRNYARFLGIDEGQAVADYLAAVGEEAIPSNTVVMEKLAAESQRRASAKRESGPSALPFNWKALVGLLFVLVIIALSWLFSAQLLRWKNGTAAVLQGSLSEQPVAPPQQSPPAPPVSSVNDATGTADEQASLPAETMTAPEDDSSASVVVPEQQTTTKPEQRNFVPPKTTSATMPAADQIRVVVKATETAYIEATRDGQRIGPGITLSTGAVQTFAATSQLKLKVGNAGGVELTWNGNPVPPLGQRGQVKTVTFGPDGLIR